MKPETSRFFCNNMQREYQRRLSLQNPVLPSFNQRENFNPEINPIKTILIRKEAEVFGVSVSIVESVGVVITAITPGSSSARDGRLRPGDVLVSLNNQSLVDVEPRRVGEILRGVDKSSSDILVQFITADNTPEQIAMHSAGSFPLLRRSQIKSDEEEEEYFDVSESEPPELPTSPPPTLISEVMSEMRMLQLDAAAAASMLSAAPPPSRTEDPSSTAKMVLPKISPIILSAKPSVPSPKPNVRVTPTEGATGRAADALVSKVKPTVPFKPIRTSLSPKDALPSKAKTKSTTVENFVGESTGLSSRQWGPQRTVELRRDPEKGLGISIISGKVDTLSGGIFIKSVLADSPAGWNGTLKRGDRILEVNGEDIRNAGHAKAVDVIKNATNPVKFIIQSLVPLPKKSDVEASPVSSEVSSSVNESATKTEVTSPVLKASSPVQSPVSVSLVPGTPSASSSNSSSRESTIKRSSSKEVPTSPSVEQQSAKGTHASKSGDENIQSEEPSASAEMAQPTKDDDIAEPLGKGKVLTKKGKQIDVGSAGNVKLSPADKAEDPESEDEFGYTHSKRNKF